MRPANSKTISQFLAVSAAYLGVALAPQSFDRHRVNLRSAMPPSAYRSTSREHSSGGFNRA